MKKAFCIIVLIGLIFLVIGVKNYTNILGSPKYIYINNYTSKKFEDILEIEYLELVNPNEFTLNKIKYCDNLKRIFISSNNKYRNLDFIGNINIYAFSFVGKCEDWSKVGELTSLKELNLYNSNYSNLSYISMLTDLNVLTIQTTSYINIEELSSLNDLRYLTIDIPNYDISCLCNLKQVETLCISHCNNVSDLSFLKYMDNVTTLKLLNLNNVNDYDFLLEMKNLHKLEILMPEENVNIYKIIALLESNGVEVVII